MSDDAPEPLPRRMTPGEAAFRQYLLGDSRGPGRDGYAAIAWQSMSGEVRNRWERIAEVAAQASLPKVLAECARYKLERDTAREVATAAERERIRLAIGSLAVTLTRPGNGPAHAQAAEVVPLPALLRLLGAGTASGEADAVTGTRIGPGEGEGTPEAVQAASGPRPSPFELWQQANGDGARYRELLREHGHLIGPGDPGYDPDAALPCGWEPGRG